MLKIKNLYKNKGNKLINDIDINIEKGTSVSNLFDNSNINRKRGFCI